MIYNKYLYWISTISLFSLLILTGIFYMVYYEKLVLYFENYDYPIYLIYPLAIAKIAGSLVVLFYKKSRLKELAYAGFFFNFVLAFFAHVMIGEFDPFPTIFMTLLVISYVTGKKKGR
ncbi:MAG: DoxX family protein [Lutibacter sp.]|uniref:DoxX family protein n=1 Tax=Lutibacter sp. TaxID=1925666 RepID=UPI0019FF618A|nr:DoxX family protein [Lutibacter sp.]NOR28902.1 DoxX family protein [Lutibacter sp.]